MADEVEDISLDRKKKKVRIDGRVYTVQEMDGVELGTWRSEMGDRAKFNSAGAVVGLRSYTGVEAALIAKCLINDEGKNVGKDVIVNWPVSCQMKLMKMCEDINGLTKESADAAKND